MKPTPLFAATFSANFGFPNALRRWIRLVAVTLLIAPVIILTLSLFASLFHAGDLAKFTTLLSSTMISTLLLLTIVLAISSPHTISVFWRILVALLLAAPWAFASLGIFSTLFPFHTVGSFAIRLVAGLAFSALALYAFRILFQPFEEFYHPWWPPDPPPDGALITAPLVPPTPVRAMSAAEKLPRASDEFDRDSGQAIG